LEFLSKPIWLLKRAEFRVHDAQQLQSGEGPPRQRPQHMRLLGVVDVQAPAGRSRRRSPGPHLAFFQRTAAWHPADRRPHPSSAREPSTPSRRSLVAHSWPGLADPQELAYPAPSGSASGPARCLPAPYKQRPGRTPSAGPVDWPGRTSAGSREPAGCRPPVPV